MKPSRLTLFLIALLWPVIVLVLYYSTNKPVTPDLALHLAQMIGHILAAALLVILAGGLGYSLARLEGLHPLARLALQAALGLGLLAIGVLIVGSTLGLAAWILWGVLLLAGILLRKACLGWLRQFAGLNEVWAAGSRFERTVAVLLALMFAATLAVALAPPVKYDALMYHLTLPQAYLAQGKISYLPWIVMSGHPQTAEMLYTWAIGLGGLETAPVLGWFFCLLASLGLLGYLFQRISIRAAWVGLGALLAGYTLAVSTAWGYVDWLGLYFGLGCLVSLDRWRAENRQSDLLLAGAFAGMAMGTKYTSAVLILVAGVALTWHVWKKKAAWWPAMLQFGAAALVLVLPWLVKNALTTGNPFYPFFFPAGAMDALRISIYQGAPPAGNWWDFFLLPLRATMLGVDGGATYSVSIGPLLLGLGALAWMGARERDERQKTALQNAALIGLSGLAIWAVGNRFSGYLIQTRMYFSLFPAFVTLAAFGYAAASRITFSGVRLGRILNAVVILVLGLNSLAVVLNTVKMGSAPAALGFTSQEDYLADNLGWYQPAVQAINNLSEPDRVLLIYEPRSLYCLPRCAPDEILDRWVRDYTQYQDFASIREAWIQQGFTHILVNRSGIEFLKTAGDPHHPLAALQALDQFLAQLPAPQKFGDAYELYPLAKGITS